MTDVSAHDAPKRPKPGGVDVFAPAQPNTRETNFWLSVLVLAGIFILTQIVVVIATLVILFTSVPMETLSDPDALVAVMESPEVGSKLLWATLLLQFPLLALFAMFWVKVYERRSLAAMGFGGGLGVGIPKIVVGWLIGAAFAGVLIVAGVTLAMVFGAPEEDQVGWSAVQAVLMDPGFMVFAAILLPVFIIQGGAEEVLVRGWMLSSNARVKGPTAALIWSSLWFGVLHLHFLFTMGVAIGSVALLTVAVVGAAFGAWALWSRSIWGPIGGHGGFNYVALMATFSYTAALEDTPLFFDDLSAKLLELLAQATDEFEPAMFVQLGLALLATLVLMGAYNARRKKEPSAEATTYD